MSHPRGPAKVSEPAKEEPEGTAGRQPSGALGPAPALLADLEERRRRDLLRLRLFGEAPGPVKVGRFVPLQRLGAGGMGVVYAAYDEQLERKVALKLLHPSSEERETAGRERLLREAQALARLSHPNVVTVYEVGVHEGGVFVAMELIRGRTLRAWRAAAPRDVREVLSVFIQAGRGLAAAHDQGIVHKDFKPENVMIGDDGRVRVLDFGLARVAGAAGDPAPGGAPASGTPAYMSPEQHANGPVDARSDQFAFCVALYEALSGERPFDGKDRAELALQVAGGALRPAAPDGKVPSWLRATLARGLRAAPAERWASMQALLAALERDPGAVRRRWLGRAGIAVAVSAATWAASAAVLERARSCDGGPERMSRVWSDAQRGLVDRALRGSGAAYAADIAPRVASRLDGYARSWVETHREACLAHRRGEQSSELFDRGMACLEDRRRELGALVKVLGEPGGKVVEHALDAAGGLELPDRCADAKRLLGEGPLGPATPAAEHVRSQLAAARADELAGRYQRALEEASEALAGAREYPPLAAEALYRQGEVQDLLGLQAEATAALEDAYSLALASRHDEVAARAATRLLLVVGFRQALFDAARPWERDAGALVERLAHVRQLRADFLNTRAMVRQKQGKGEEAQADYLAAIALYQGLYGEDHRAVALALGNLATLVHQRGDSGEAIRLYRRALSIDERTLWRDHPALAFDLGNLGLALLDHGDLQESFTALRRALEIKEKTFGAEDPNLAQALNNLGNALLDTGRYQEAFEQYSRALRVSQRTAQPDALRIALTRHFLGRTLLRLGRVAEARGQLEQALEVRTRLLGASSALAGETLSFLGEVAQAEGRRSEAAARYQEALDILERQRDARHPDVAYPLTGLGDLRLAGGDPAAAIPLLERAADIRAARGGSRIERARARFLLARALATAPPAPAAADRARALAAEALGDLESIGLGAGRQAAEIRSWLRIPHGVQRPPSGTSPAVP